MNDLITLKRFLQSPEDFPWDLSLYLPRNREKWSLDSLLALCDPDDCEEGQDDPEVAIAHDLTYALGVSTGQDIVANAKEQEPEAAIHDLFRAFLYYYENDAFIQFNL